MKKKIVPFLLSVVLVLSCFCGLCTLSACSGERAITLRIANQGEYMPEEVYLGFVDWYYEKTGKEVIVEYKEFDTCENLYTWIARKHEDYDLICPSDYMLQRMRSEGLLQRLDEETLQAVNNAVNPAIIDMAKDSYDPEFAYSCPYLWGTLGIMFNTNSDGEAGLQNEETTFGTWDVMWDGTYRNKIFMKDSVRDAYSVAMIYAMRNELRAAMGEERNYDSEAYQAILHDIFDSSSEEKVALAKASLLAQKPNVYDYEVDSAKDVLLRDSEGEHGYFGLFWSCDAGYIMTGDDEEDTNKNLYYTVPYEGGNVWVDSFAIPVYSQNSEAANWFIRYLCEGECAYDEESEELTSVGYACMDYAGTTTAMIACADQYKADLEEDEDGFFEGTYEGFKEMYMDMLFPSEETLKRCAIMKDLGTYNYDLDEMWIDVLLG